MAQSRRALLSYGATAALAATVAVPAALAAGPDAELIALCTEYVALDRAFVANSYAGADMFSTDPAWVALNDEGCAMVPRLHALEAEIGGCRARTPEGLRALVQVARHVVSSDADRGAVDLLEGGEVMWPVLESVLAILDAGRLA